MREDEGEGKLVDTDLYVEKVDLNDYLTRKDWDEIGAKYRDENDSGPRSIGERYVYYTDLLDRYEQRKREKQVAENAGGQGMSTSQIIHREVVLKKELLNKVYKEF